MKAIQIGISIALMLAAILWATQLSSIGEEERKAAQEINSELDKAIEAHKEDISRRVRGSKGIP